MVPRHEYQVRGSAQRISDKPNGCRVRIDCGKRVLQPVHVARDVLP